MRKVLNPCFVVAIGTLFSAMSTSVGQDTKKSPAQEPDFGVFKIPDGTPKPKDTLLSTVIVGSEVLSVAISPDGTLLATAESEGPAKLWDVKTGKLRATLNQGRVGNAESVAFALGGKIVIVAGDLEVPKNPLAFDGVNVVLEGVSIWRANGEFVSSRTLTQAKLKGEMSSNPAGRHLFRGRLGSAFGKKIKTPLARLAVSADGSWFAVTRPGGVDHFFIASKKKSSGSIDVILKKFAAPAALESWPNDVAISRRLYMQTTQWVSEGKTIPLWTSEDETTDGEIQTQIEEWALNIPTRTLTAPLYGDYDAGLYGDYVALSEPPSLVATGNRIYDDDFKTVATLAVTYRICDAVFGPNKGRLSETYGPNSGEWVATAGENNRLAFWDVATGQKLAQIRAHDDRINSLSLSADGSRVATASDDGTVKLWDVEAILKQRPVDPLDKIVNMPLATEAWQFGRDWFLMCLQQGAGKKVVRKPVEKGATKLGIELPALGGERDVDAFFDSMLYDVSAIHKQIAEKHSYLQAGLFVLAVKLDLLRLTYDPKVPGRSVEEAAKLEIPAKVSGIPKPIWMPVVEALKTRGSKEEINLILVSTLDELDRSFTLEDRTPRDIQILRKTGIFPETLSEEMKKEWIPHWKPVLQKLTDIWAKRNVLEPEPLPLVYIELSEFWRTVSPSDKWQAPSISTIEKEFGKPDKETTGKMDGPIVFGQEHDPSNDAFLPMSYKMSHYGKFVLVSDSFGNVQWLGAPLSVWQQKYSVPYLNSVRK